MCGEIRDGRGAGRGAVPPEQEATAGTPWRGRSHVLPRRYLLAPLDWSHPGKAEDLQASLLAAMVSVVPYLQNGNSPVSQTPPQQTAASFIRICLM